MVQKLAVIEKADNGEQRRPGENPSNLLLGHAVDRHQNGQRKSQINGDTAEKRDRFYVNLPRTRLVHHSETQSETTDRDGKTERRKKRHNKSDQIGMYGYHCSHSGYRAVSIFSRTARTCSFCLVAKYQSMVLRKPSRKGVFGSQPISFFARALSATRFTGPVGMSGRKRISAFCAEKSSTIFAASSTRMRSIVPRLTAVPSSIFSAARIVPLTMSST